MDLNRYTNKAQEALLKSNSLAEEYVHTAIEPLHMLIALMDQHDGVVPEIIAKIGARPPALRAELQDPLAMYILEGRVREGDHIIADINEAGKGIEFTTVPQEELV